MTYDEQITRANELASLFMESTSSFAFAHQAYHLYEREDEATADAVMNMVRGIVMDPTK